MQHLPAARFDRTARTALRLLVIRAKEIDLPVTVEWTADGYTVWYLLDGDRRVMAVDADLYTAAARAIVVVDTVIDYVNGELARAESSPSVVRAH